MEIVEIKQGDDLRTVARKCNANFKNMAWDTKQAARKQGLMDAEEINAALTEIHDEMTEMENVTIPNQVNAAIASELSLVTVDTPSGFFTESDCTPTGGLVTTYGKVASFTLSYRLNSALSVPTNGNTSDVTLGTLNDGYRPVRATNVILDPTYQVMGDIDTSGNVKIRSAAPRNSTYTIDANAVLYARFMLLLA